MKLCSSSSVVQRKLSEIIIENQGSDSDYWKSLKRVVALLLLELATDLRGQQLSVGDRGSPASCSSGIQSIAIGECFANESTFSLYGLSWNARSLLGVSLDPRISVESSRP